MAGVSVENNAIFYNKNVVYFFIVLVFATFVRFILPYDFPPGFAGHAIAHSHQSLEFRDAISQTLSTGSADWPSVVVQFGLMSFFHGVVFYIFGQGIWQSMLPAQLFGVGSAICSYLFGKRVGGIKFGLLLGLSVAASPWNIAFSRYGDAEHALPVFHFWAVACSIVHVRGLLTAALAGLIVAGSWYVYATNQILPMILLITFFIVSPKISRKKYLGFCISFLIFSAPAIIPSWRDGFYYPIRSTLPDNSNYQIVSVSQLLENSAGIFSQLFLNSSDAWYTNSLGGFGIFGNILIFFGVASGLHKFYKTQSLTTLIPFLVFSLGIIPAVIANEVSFRRGLVSGSTLLYFQAIGALFLMKKFKVFCVITYLIACYGVYMYFFETSQPESSAGRGRTIFINEVLGFTGKQRLVFTQSDDIYQFKDFFRFMTSEDPESRGISLEVVSPDSCRCTNERRVLYYLDAAQLSMCCSLNQCSNYSERNFSYYIMSCK